MKNIFKTMMAAVAGIAAAVAMGGCESADPEFVHTDNLINQLFMMTTLQGNQHTFTIDEYDAHGNLVTGRVSAEDVEGGYGIAHIEFPLYQMDEIDLTNVYLVAHVGYDVIITPGLQGTHDITGDGIVISAKAGSGKVRKYRVYGEYN